MCTIRYYACTHTVIYNKNLLFITLFTDIFKILVNKTFVYNFFNNLNSCL